MKCPSCKTTHLKATRLDHGLPALSCQACEGVLIPLLSYRDWAERAAQFTFQAQTDLDVSVVAEHESRMALNCPKCSGLMTKYQIKGGTQNRLDLCDHCDEAWLDQGEWELLKSLEMSTQMPKIFTEAWQQKIKHSISEDKLKSRFAEILGEPDLEKAAAFRKWLNDHDKRAELLFFISQK